MIITRNLSKQGAIVIEGRHRIPELAKITLDRWALKRVHDLKIVTKAHKYTFPFHDRYHQKRAYRKVFEIVKKQLERQIPYISTAIVEFLDIGNTVSETITLRIGPYADLPQAMPISRYLRRLNRYLRQAGIPITLNERVYVCLTTDGQGTVSALEIRATLNRVAVTEGYLILFHLPQVIKAIETLHRKAIYRA
jgi:hypothetical protein